MTTDRADQLDLDEIFVLRTKEVSKHFGAVKAVDQLSMSIFREWITCIVGPNGSGKSSLINLLSGMLPLDEGVVVIDGVGLRVLKAHETPGHGITRTFQEVRLFDQISVWNNIMVTLTDRRFLPRALRANETSTQGEGSEYLAERRHVGEKGCDGDGPILRPA